VKILDFGLAKLTQLDQSQSQTEIPTRRVDTDPGVVMGTAGYMSPEQITGRPVDHRSDIFSFGAILYEMLSGRRAFHGDSPAETMSAILKEDPADLSETNHNISPALERLVNHCLEKNPQGRFHSARDLAFALEALSDVTTTSERTMTVPAMPASRPRARERFMWLSLIAVLLIAAALFAFLYSRRGPAQSPVAFSIAAPEKTNFNQLAISPDGRNLLFVANAEGKRQLWLRPLNSIAAPQPLPATEGANGFPIWSADSRSIAFLAGDKLKRIDLDQGTPQTICSIEAVATGRGFSGTWNRDGVILFFLGRSGIYRVPAAGGQPIPVPVLDVSRNDLVYRWPWFLPDGNHFLCLGTTNLNEEPTVYLASLDGKPAKRLLAADSNAIYSPSLSPATSGSSGHLLFVREGALLAQAFDASSQALSGEPFRVADQVRTNPGRRGFFSVSDNGTLVYAPDSGDRITKLAWFDRTGKPLGPVGSAGPFKFPVLSPDEKRIAVEQRDPKTRTADIYVKDLERDTTLRLTFDPSDDVFAVWSPDGSRIAWVSNRGGKHQLYQRLASGGGQEELLLQPDVLRLTIDDWSKDGRFIIYTSTSMETRTDLWILPLDGDRQPFPFLQTPYLENRAQFSPNGRWVVYESNESGKPEVYVRTFPASDQKWSISTKGGRFPRWRPDGKELFYISGDSKMMAVELKPGSTFAPGVPKELFDASRMDIALSNGGPASANGQRFLFLIEDQSVASTLSVLVNWTAQLKK
jgi:Tol biopolymer transport system component